MTFLELMRKVNRKRWMVCTMFQVPSSARQGEFDWKVTIGYRGAPHAMSSGVGSSPVRALRDAWEQRRERVEAYKKYALSYAGSRDRPKKRREDQRDQRPRLKLKLRKARKARNHYND